MATANIVAYAFAVVTVFSTAFLLCCFRAFVREVRSPGSSARIQLGLALAQKGMLSEAISELEKARDQAGGYAVTDTNTVNSLNSASAARVSLPVVHAMLGKVYAIAGRKSDAEKQLRLLRVASRTRYVAPSYFAIVYTALGDQDQAFAWLEKSYQDRSEHMLYLKVEPLVDPLRHDPRFESLLKRVRLDY